VTPTIRLDAASTFFLSSEDPDQAITITAVAVVASGGAITLADVRAQLGAHIGAIAALRALVVAVPFGVHNPVLVDDPQFDLDRHLRHTTLAAPAQQDALARLCGRLAEVHLDRRHPLWRLTLVSGLPGDRQAFVLSIHHGLMDAVAMVNTLTRIFSPAGSEASIWSPPGAVPSRMRLVVDALADRARQGREVPGLVRRTARGLLALRRETRHSAVTLAKPGPDTPWCSLHGAQTFRRELTVLELPLAEVKMVKEAAGVTVNDVVLAVVGGSLRTYLAERHDLPGRPLLAHIPAGLDRPGSSARTLGNRVGAMSASLATDIADPWQRLLAIGSMTSESKRRRKVRGAAIGLEWLEFVAPFILEPSIRWFVRHARTHRDKIYCNLVVSNTRGPAELLRFGSIPVEELYIAGAMTTDAGVDLVVCDYQDSLRVAILTFTEAVTNPAELAVGIRQGLRELSELAAAAQDAAPPQKAISVPGRSGSR
jgi:diacylglycerol O-acyltransferase